jgi:hypothetical protein
MNTSLAHDLRNSQPPTLREELDERHGRLAERRDELLEAAGRVPATIDDEEIAGRVQDFIKQIGACTKTAETFRVSEKEPHLESGRVVDGFFRAITDPLAKAKKEIEGRLTLYLRKKAEAERRAREEAERLAREEAERTRRAAEEAATKLTRESDLQSAIEAETTARQAAADAMRATANADAKAAELSRTRGDYGSVGSLRTFWDFRVEDRSAIDLETLRPFIPVDALDKAVRAFINANKPDKSGGDWPKPIRGVRIFENTSAVVR